MPLTYRTEVASAQVKSAILLAGLNAPGTTRVIESAATRDHTERMLRHFGGKVAVETLEDGASAITVTGHPRIDRLRISTCRATPAQPPFRRWRRFWVPGSQVTLRHVGMNPLA